MTETARVELYNLFERGRNIGNGWLVVRVLADGRRANTLGVFGADEGAARAFAAAWRPAVSSEAELVALADLWRTA